MRTESEKAILEEMKRLGSLLGASVGLNLDSELVKRSSKEEIQSLIVDRIKAHCSGNKENMRVVVKRDSRLH